MPRPQIKPIYAGGVLDIPKIRGNLTFEVGGLKKHRYEYEADLNLEYEAKYNFWKSLPLG